MRGGSRPTSVVTALVAAQTRSAVECESPARIAPAHPLKDAPCHPRFARYMTARSSCVARAAPATGPQRSAPRYQHTLFLRGDVERPSDAGLPLEANLPERSADVADVRLLHVGQTHRRDQLRDPNQSRAHVRRQFVQFGVNRLVQRLDGPRQAPGTIPDAVSPGRVEAKPSSRRASQPVNLPQPPVEMVQLATLGLTDRCQKRRGKIEGNGPP